MKKCENCKFFKEYNSDGQLINLCLCFCENRSSKSECISVERYTEALKKEYSDLKNNVKNLFSRIDSDSLNPYIFSHETECKQKILEYMKCLYQEIQDWEYYFCHIDTK